MKAIIIAMALAIIGCSSIYRFPSKTLEAHLGDISEDNDEPDIQEDGVEDSIDESAREDIQEDDPSIEAEPDQPCTVWYLDSDHDGWGTWDSYVCTQEKPDGYAEQGGDCCDTNLLVHPGQNEFFKVPFYCSSESWDYNCDGSIDYGYANHIRNLVDCGTSPVCHDGNQGWKDTIPECGQAGIYIACRKFTLETCLRNEIWNDTMACN